VGRFREIRTKSDYILVELSSLKEALAKALADGDLLDILVEKFGIKFEGGVKHLVAI
jgi:hypothetical protein